MSVAIILIAFCIYLVMMIVIGAVNSKKNSNAEEYFLGGRNLGGFVAALSAQASDMSGWLLMGLPGAIFVYGMNSGDGWCAIGLLVGTILNWIIVASRLRKYTIKANNSVTLPRFLENRYRDEKRILLTISSIIIALFFTVYCASALAAGGKLFKSIFNMDYHLALFIGTAVILAYTFLGGFMAVCATDFVQGTIMLIALIFVPVVAIHIMHNNDIAIMTALKPAIEENPGFINMFKNVDAKRIFSGLSWGLGYFGMPHILVRFMAVKNEKEMTKSKTVAILWVTISLFAAIAIAIVGRAYMDYEYITSADVGSERIFIEMIKKVFIEDYSAPFIAGIFLCGILAAIMSTADSQLLVSASSIAEDIYKGIFNKEASSMAVMWMSRAAILLVAVIAFAIAWNPESSIMNLVSDAWSGLGASFGPLVLCSLFWKRTNLQGAVSGLISGALTVVLWDYIPIIGGKTIKEVTGIYSLAVGFIVSILFIIIISLATPAPSEEIQKEFDEVKNVE